MKPHTQLQILGEAADILNDKPWAPAWRVTVEYPGYLLVIISDGVMPVNDRCYTAGFANETLTVDAVTAEGEPCTSAILPTVDTGIACAGLDGYRLAIHVAAAIDRMEQEGA